MAEGKYQSIYFPRGETVDDLKELADSTGSTISKVVSNLCDVSVDSLKKAAKQNKREVTITITVPLFGRGDGQV